MNKEIYYILFNEKLNEFFTDIIAVFPDIKDFKTFKSGLSVLKNINVKSPQIIFNNHILNKFKEEIYKKDENFFLNEAEYDILSKETDYWLDFIKQIKNIWKTMSEENKEIVWKYLHILCILSDKCNDS